MIDDGYRLMVCRDGDARPLLHAGTATTGPTASRPSSRPRCAIKANVVPDRRRGSGGLDDDGSVGLQRAAPPQP